RGVQQGMDDELPPIRGIRPGLFRRAQRLCELRLVVVVELGYSGIQPFGPRAELVFRINRPAELLDDLSYCRLGVGRVRYPQVLAIEYLDGGEGNLDVMPAHADQQRNDDYPGAQRLTPQQDGRFLAYPL